MKHYENYNFFGVNHENNNEIIGNRWDIDVDRRCDFRILGSVALRCVDLGRCFLLPSCGFELRETGKRQIEVTEK